MTRVEIVTRGEARRSYTPDEKSPLPTEAAEPGARVLLVARRHGVSPSLVHRWRRQAENRAARPAQPRPPAFVPLLVDGGAVEVVLRTGRVLRVRTGADVAVIARLAAALDR